MNQNRGKFNRTFHIAEISSERYTIGRIYFEEMDDVLTVFSFIEMLIRHKFDVNQLLTIALYLYVKYVSVGACFVAMSHFATPESCDYIRVVSCIWMAKTSSLHAYVSACRIRLSLPCNR